MNLQSLYDLELARESLISELAEINEIEVAHKAATK